MVKHHLFAAILFGSATENFGRLTTAHQQQIPLGPDNTDDDDATHARRTLDKTYELTSSTLQVLGVDDVDESVSYGVGAQGNSELQTNDKPFEQVNPEQMRSSQSLADEMRASLIDSDQIGEQAGGVLASITKAFEKISKKDKKSYKDDTKELVIWMKQSRDKLEAALYSNYQWASDHKNMCISWVIATVVAIIAIIVFALNIAPTDGSYLDNTDALQGNEPFGLRTWQKFCHWVPLLCFGPQVAVFVYCAVYLPIYALLTCAIIICVENLRAIGLLWRIIPWSWKILHRRAPAPPVANSDSDRVLHIVMLPAYNESINVMCMTLDSLVAQQGPGEEGCSGEYAQERIGVILCFEEREGDAAIEKERILQEEYNGKFVFMKVSRHPDLEGHAQGPGANTFWGTITQRDAFEHYSKHFDVMVTKLDADTDCDTQYFSTLATTHAELEPAARECTMYAPHVFHFKNYWRQPAIARSSTAVKNPNYANNLLSGSDFIHCTYSLTWKQLDAVGSWDPGYATEDCILNMRCFLANPIDHQVKHISLPVINYAPEKPSYADTVMENIAQQRRHAMGIETGVLLLQLLPICRENFMAKANTCGDSLRFFWASAWKIFDEFDPHFRISLSAFPLVFVPIFMNAVTLHEFLGYKVPFAWPMEHPGQSPWILTHDPVFRFSIVALLSGFVFCGAVPFISLWHLRVMMNSGRVEGDYSTWPWYARWVPTMVIHEAIVLTAVSPIVGIILGFVSELYAMIKLPLTWKNRTMQTYHTAPKPLEEVSPRKKPRAFSSSNRPLFMDSQMVAS